ncbi:MAG: SoxR reducing system RseC family protein [Rugosibacter sp.]|jgi:positive regulator of sigma E activity
MMHCEARVLSTTPEEVCVEIAPRQAACAHCPTPVLCQAGMASAARKLRRYHLPNTMNLTADDAGSSVAITVADGAVFRAACLSYGLPLFLMLVFVFAGQFLGRDVGAMLGMLFGVALGFLVVKYFSPYGRLHRRQRLLGMQPLPAGQIKTGILDPALSLGKSTNPFHPPA